jgi:hypothetical protein
MTKKRAENEASVASKKSSRSIVIKKSPKTSLIFHTQPLIPGESQIPQVNRKKGPGRPTKEEAKKRAFEKAEMEKKKDFLDE